MGIVTLVVLGLTLLGMAFGALFGFLRGRERAILRLVLVVVSAFLALALRGTVTDIVMNISIDGATLQEIMTEGFASGDASVPQSVVNLIFAFAEILIGFVAYFILLFSLRFLTWILVFPFLKLIIRFFEKIRADKALLDSYVENEVTEAQSVPENVEPEEEKESEDTVAETENDTTNEEYATENEAETSEDVIAEASDDVEPVVEMACEEAEPVKTVSVATVRKNIRKKYKKALSKHRGQGALVGLVQGVLVAYFLFAPLTCLLTQINAITSVEINGKPLVNIPSEIGITEYSESAIGKIYSTTGRWYYNIMTSTTDANGNKVSLEGTLNTVSLILNVANVATSLEDDFKILQQEDATPEEKIDAMNTLGDKLISVGTSMDQLDDSTKTMIEDLVKEMGGEDASQEEIDEMMEMLTPEVFTQAGNAMKSYAEYEQVKLDGTTLTPEQANNMVNSAYSAIKMIGDIQFEVNEADKPTIKTAIDAKDITAEDKDTLYNVFGIQVVPEQ